MNNFSATWPPIAVSMLARHFIFVVERESPSLGSMKVAPRLPPLATTVALYSFGAPAV